MIRTIEQQTDDIPLHAVFEDWKNGERSRQTMLYAISRTALNKQIDIIAEPYEASWRERKGHTEIIDFVLSSDDHRQARDRTLVRLLGGVVAGVTEDNSFWVVAAKPSELQAPEPGKNVRYWRFDLERTHYLADGAWPLQMHEREQVVVDDFVVQSLTRLERYQREFESNMYWFGNATGPTCDERSPFFWSSDSLTSRISRTVFTK